MKRYILFAGIEDYPSGGMNDMIKTDDDISVLEKIGDKNIKNRILHWWHIYDTQSGEIVKAHSPTPKVASILLSNGHYFVT